MASKESVTNQIDKVKTNIHAYIYRWRKREREISYLVKRTTKTPKAPATPTIPIKVATPFKRTYQHVIQRKS